MKADQRPVLFAAVFGTVCAVILTAAGRLTAPYRAVNEKAEEMRNYLTALGVPLEKGASPAALIQTFERNVRVVTNGTLAVYTFQPEGRPEPEALAVAVVGMGLWGPIKGVLALDPDARTIRGLRFFQQEETPGLGGDIGSDAFTSKFKGKRIVAADGRPGFRVVKSGNKTDENSVDGITGATMTCDRVQVILQAAAERVVNERSGGHGGNP